MSFVIPFFLAIAPVALAASSSPSSLSQFTSVWSNTTSASSVSSVSAFSSAIHTSSAPLTSSVVLSTSSSPYLSLPNVAALSSSSSTSSASSSIASICSSADSCLPSASSSSLALSAPTDRQSLSSLAANSSVLASSLSASTNSTPLPSPLSLLLSRSAVSDLPAKTSPPSLLLSLNASTSGPLSPSLSTPASQLSSSPIVKGYISYPANLTVATALTSNVSTLSANTTGLHASNSSVPTSTNSSACSAYCTHSWPVVTTWSWVTANPTAPASKLWTATATVTATLVVIVDELTNTTQTSLVDNGPVTSWQTVMTAKFLNGDLVLRGGSPVVLTFPTNYVDYGPSYKVSKAGKSSEPILPTNGACSHTTRYTLPSHHPPLPQPVPSPVDTLPSQVWGLQLYSGDGQDSADGFFKSQFPFEAAFQLCFPYNKTGGSEGPGPAALISVASLTTITATQTRTSNAKSSTSTPTTNTPTPPVNSKPNPPAESTTTEDNPLTDGAQQPTPTDTRVAIVPTPLPKTTSVISTDDTGNIIVNDGERTSTLEPPQNMIRPVTLSDNTLTVVTLSPATTTTPPTFDISGQKLSVGGVVTLGSGPSTTVVGMATDAAGNTLLNVNGQISTISNPETPAAPSLVVAGTTLIPIAGTSAAFSIGDSVLAVDRPVTLGIGSPSTTVLSLSSDSIGNTVLISNGQSSTLSAPSVAAPAAGFVLFGSTVTANAPVSTNQGFVVGGQTLAVGGTITLDSGPSATTLALQTDTAGNSILVSNGHSSIVPAAATGIASLVVNGQTITPSPVPTNSLGFVVAGQTLTLGGAITLGSGPSATTLALQTDFEGYTFIVSNGVSSKIAAPTSRIEPLTIDGKTISATSLPSGGTGFVIEGQTLTPGGVITLSSGPSATILSLTTDATGNTVLVSNRHTSTVSPAPITSIAINGQTITASGLPTGGIGFVVSGQTLTPGGSITVSGTVYTLTTDAAGHTVLASNGHASLLPGQASAGALTINGQVFTPTSLPSTKGTGYIINGQTLAVGGAVTISGTAYTLTTDSDGRTVLVSDGHTSMVPGSAAASTTGRFVPVRSSTGLGPGATATATSSGVKVSQGYRGVSELRAFEFSLVVLLVVGSLVGIS